MSVTPEPTATTCPEMVERVTLAIADKLNGDPRWMSDVSILARAAIEAYEAALTPPGAGR